MKKIIILALAFMISVVCNAAAPNLACEKIFEKKQVRSQGHELTIVTQPSNYFRSVSFSNDPALEKEIEKAVEQDRKKSFNTVERWDGDRHYTILSVENNGHNISIGFYKESDGSVRLFIQSDPEAFK